MTFKKACWIITLCSFVFSVQDVLGQDRPLDVLLKRLPIEANDSTKAELLAEIGDQYYEIDFDSMVYYYNNAIALSQDIPYFSIELSSWRSLGYVYSNRRADFDTSLVFFNKALDLSIAQLDSIAIAYTLSDIGRTYWKQGKHYESLEYHLQVREIGEKLNSHKVLLRANTSMGVLENENGNNKNAKEHYFAAISLADTLGKVRSKGLIFNNLGKAYRDDKDYANALKYFNKADSIFTNLNDNDNLTLVNYNIGMTLTQQGFPEKGIEYYNLALNKNKTIGNKETEMAIQIAMSNAYQKSNKPNQAFRLAKDAQTILEEINTDSTYYEELFEVLAKSYESMGNHALSLKYYKKYIQLKTDKSRAEEKKKITSLIHLYDLKKKENKILELETNNIKKDKKINASKANLKVMIFAFFALASFSFLTFYVYQLRELKKADSLKNSLAKNLHDNIGSSLNHIKMLSNRMVNSDSDLKEKDITVTKIKNISNQVIYNMHDMVWSLDKEKESIGDLLTRMQDHAEVFLGDFNIPYKFNIDVPNKNVILKTKEKLNVFLIFKESVNNILKHTENSKVIITISNKNSEHLSMEVSNSYSAKKTGIKTSTKTGINNMKKRAESLRGKLGVIDKPGSFIVQFNF